MEFWSHLAEVLVYRQDQPLLFSSGVFLCLFSVLVLGYLVLHQRAGLRTLYLTAFSFYFYYLSSGWFMLLLAFCALFNYVLGLWLARHREKPGAKPVLVLGIVLNLSFLLYFKYSNFFLFNWSALTGGEFSALKLVLPVGISFFTFQTISYLVDVYTKRIEACTQLLDFAFYLSFFPQLVAGPIVRAIDFLPQINRRLRYVADKNQEAPSPDYQYIDRRDLGQGLFMILKGFIKKAVIADYIAQYSDLIFGNPLGYSGFEGLMGLYAYTLQIYCDFSGYSDMAIGLALLLGFHLPENFRTPYHSRSITEFWRRWHISLSSWLRDYIYIALGGNRKGPGLQYLFLMITMLVGGFWHGASWAFVFWGGMHGLGLMVHKFWLSYREANPQALLPRLLFGQHALGQFLAWFLTFHFVALLWVYFRAGDFILASQFIAHIFSDFSWDYLLPFWAVRPGVLLCLGLGLLLHLLSAADKIKAAEYFASLPVWLKAAVFLLFIQLALQLQDAEVQPFIYFQF